MSRRNRQRGHLHAVPDPNPAVQHPKDGRRRRGREPDPGPFPTDEFDFLDVGDDIPPLARAGIAAEMAAEMAAMSRAADDRPIDPFPDPVDGVPDDFEDQLIALGLPPELIEQTRTLGEDHRDELAGLLTAATAMMTGDPVAGLLGIWEPLLDRKMTAFDAELATAEILWTFDGASGEDDLVDGLTRLLEVAGSTGRPEALVMCRMLAHLGPPEIRSLAVRTATTLAEGGITDRPWVSSLGTATFVRAYGFTDDGARVLAVEFAHGRRGHAFAFVIDERERGLVGMYATDDVDGLYRDVRLEALDKRRLPCPVSAAEAGRLIRTALTLPFTPEDDDDEADMEAIVPVVRERLRHLPTDAQTGGPGSPDDDRHARRADGDDDEPASPGVDMHDFGPHPRARARLVHRVKVTLTNSQPLVWRRLEVSSEITLSELHEVLGLSFGRVDDRPGRFTARGRVHDLDNAGRLTIGELATRKGHFVDYMAGDDRALRIRVEEIGPGRPEVGYPRCLDGHEVSIGHPGPDDVDNGFDDGFDDDFDDDDGWFDVDELNDRLETWVRRR